MISAKFSLRLLILILSVSASVAAVAQQISSPEPQTGTIIGTVIDVNDGMVPGATVSLASPSLPTPQHVVTNDNGFFQLDHVKAGIPYLITISANGFANWTSSEVILKPGQYLELTGIRLKIAVAETTVNAIVSTEEIAAQQVVQRVIEVLFCFLGVARQMVRQARLVFLFNFVDQGGDGI